jgi:hypothetical protein
MRRVRLSAGEWSANAEQATSFVDRLRGLRALSAHDRLLIETRSIHTIGLGRAVTVVVVGRDRRVLESTTLGPNRVLVRMPARYLLELPAGSEVPPPRAILQIVDV